MLRAAPPSAAAARWRGWQRRCAALPRAGDRPRRTTARCGSTACTLLARRRGGVRRQLHPAQARRPGVARGRPARRRPTALDGRSPGGRRRADDAGPTPSRR
ncbi:MAG: hypothetical protein MZW92_73345 [Comamonadaceae bacterium]|nr:hypothetical protein [Comamonadaceae bacterium]